MSHNLAVGRTKILFSSLSNKIALYKKVSEAAKRINPDVVVFGGDYDTNCKGAEEIGDRLFLKMKRLTDYSHESMLDFLRKNGISHVIPSRDGELVFWARFQAELKSNEVSVMISSEEAVRLLDDKLDFYNRCKDFIIPAILTTTSLQYIEEEKYVVKERFGSGSKDIGLNLSTKEAINHSNSLNSPIYQPYIEGREFSAETWMDDNSKCRGVVLRWRLKIVNGESHKTTIFKNEKWEELLCKTFERIEGLRGHCLAQVIVDKNDTLHLVEINPRLGGASPLSLDSGLFSIDWFLLETLNHKELIPDKAKITFGKTLIKSQGKVEILNSEDFDDEQHYF